MAKAKREYSPDDYMKPFPKRLRLLMEENGLSQNRLAKILGISRQAISSYALGASLPDSEKITTIAKYFKVSTDYLLGISNYRRQENKNIGEVTGLSEKSIMCLKYMRNERWMDAVNFIIEQTNFNEKSHNKNTIIGAIHDYLDTFGDGNLLISNYGDIFTNIESLEKAYSHKVLDNNVDYLKISMVHVDEVLESVFLSAVSDNLKWAREELKKAGEPHGNDNETE